MPAAGVTSTSPSDSESETASTVSETWYGGTARTTTEARSAAISFVKPFTFTSRPRLESSVSYSSAFARALSGSRDPTMTSWSVW